MKRNVFLIISAVLAVFFGMHMRIAPGKMLNNMITSNSVDLQHTLQWPVTILVMMDIINFLLRNDTGSYVLRAVMIGNIILHITGFAVDAYDYSIDFIKMPELVMGAIVHGLLPIGFIYYLMKLSK